MIEPLGILILNLFRNELDFFLDLKLMRDCILDIFYTFFEVKFFDVKLELIALKLIVIEKILNYVFEDECTTLDNLKLLRNLF